MPLLPSPHHGIRESQSPVVRRLQIFVLFNGQDTTVAALRTAAGFVAGLGGDIIVAAPLIVPYPLPLQCPPVDRRVLVAQIQSAIVQSGIGCGVQNVLIAYTRDDHDAWRALLPAHCIVIVGKAGRWSPIRRFRAWRAAEYLRKLGHEVLVA